jgi:hypothetical protein
MSYQIAKIENGVKYLLVNVSIPWQRADKITDGKGVRLFDDIEYAKRIVDPKRGEFIEAMEY